MPIKTRKPTGAPPWPLVLVEGPEKSGKSWAAAELSASDRIGHTYWLDLGQGAADEYASIPGANYDIVDHDGTWHDIVDQVEQIHTAAATSELPVALVIDSMTAEWDLLKDWTSHRARDSKFARQKLRDDPNAEIKPSGNLWNDAGDRHQDLMRLLTTFPGIVIMTARAKEAAPLDTEGRPIDKAREYRVEGHRNLASDASIWIRLSRDDHPQVIGVRSANAAVRPGVDKPLSRSDLTLAWAIFDVLGLDVSTTGRRQLTELVSDEAEMAARARAELGEFIRAHELRYPPIAEAFYRQYDERLEDTNNPDAVRKLLRQLRSDHPRNPEGERTLGDACAVLGLDQAAVRARFITQHLRPPHETEQAAVIAFCDVLNTEAAQAEADRVDAGGA